MEGAARADKKYTFLSFFRLFWTKINKAKIRNFGSVCQFFFSTASTEEVPLVQIAFSAAIDETFLKRKGSWIQKKSHCLRKKGLFVRFLHPTYFRVGTNFFLAVPENCLALPWT